jgi:hypothetical protein
VKRSPFFNGNLSVCPASENSSMRWVFLDDNTSCHRAKARTGISNERIYNVIAPTPQVAKGIKRMRTTIKKYYDITADKKL